MRQLFYVAGKRLFWDQNFFLLYDIHCVIIIWTMQTLMQKCGQNTALGRDLSQTSRFLLNV